MNTGISASASRGRKVETKSCFFETENHWLYITHYLINYPLHHYIETGMLLAIHCRDNPELANRGRLVHNTWVVCHYIHSVITFMNML